jgi:hypothetical protein
VKSLSLIAEHKAVESSFQSEDLNEIKMDFFGERSLLKLMDIKGILKG